MRWQFYKCILFIPWTCFIANYNIFFCAAISNLFIQLVIDCSLFSAEAHFIPRDMMRDLRFWLQTSLWPLLHLMDQIRVSYLCPTEGFIRWLIQISTISKVYSQTKGKKGERIIGTVQPLAIIRIKTNHFSDPYPNTGSDPKHSSCPQCETVYAMVWEDLGGSKHFIFYFRNRMFVPPESSSQFCFLVLQMHT